MNCSECERELNVPDDAVKGEILTCPDCGTDFEIASISDGKVDLKVAEKVGEDWGE